MIPQTKPDLPPHVAPGTKFQTVEQPHPDEVHKLYRQTNEPPLEVYMNTKPYWRGGGVEDASTGTVYPVIVNGWSYYPYGVLHER